MKNSLLLLALSAIMSISACSQVGIDDADKSQDNNYCKLTVNYLDDSILSKTVGQTSANETLIQNVQVFVFRADSDSEPGVLDACLSAGFSSPLNYDASSSPFTGLTLTCTVGAREIWAIVNGSTDHTTDGSVGSKSALLSKTISLNEGSPSKLFMIGSSSASLTPGRANVDVTVKRAYASIVLKSIKNEMEAKIYQAAASFKIENIYLTNVPAKTDYAFSLTPSSLGPSDWFGKLGRETDSSKSALICDNQSPITIEHRSEDNTVHTFYSFPNSCSPSSSSSWSARATRLVVEAQYNDGTSWHKCYYPITLYNPSSGKGIERNKQYNVELTIKRPGSSSPEQPVEFDSVTGSITVAAWDTGDSYTETI